MGNDLFNIIAGISSIAGLILSVIALFTSGQALKKVKTIKNKINKSSIGGDFIGGDRNEH